MEDVEVLDAVRAKLDRWGWVQLAGETEQGLDLVTAFEAVSQVRLHRATAQEDAVADVFADPGLDRALALVAEIVGGDPDDGPLPAQRWAWVHALTIFNDAPTTMATDVRRVLDMAIEVAARRRASDR